MSSLTQGALIGAFAMALFMTGMPIAFALGLTSVVSIILFLGPGQFDLFGKIVFDSLNNFGLLAIPLFVLMGNIFGGSTASRQLFEAGEAWLSRLRGGLAMSSVVASAIFAALTGSSPATAAAIGRVAIPEMQRRGYSTRIASGAVAAGGTLGILIPPSVTLILYGIASEQSIGQLFAGGIVPGIIITLLFCVWIYIATSLERRRATPQPPTPPPAVPERTSTSAQRRWRGSDTPVPGAGARPLADSGGVRSRTAPPARPVPVQHVPREYGWGERFAALVKVLPFLVLIAAILTVLYAGIATPSEAAAVGVALVLLLVGVAYRGLPPRQFVRVLLETTNQSTMILTIVAFSAAVATVLSYLRVPQDLAGTVTELEVNRWVIMLAINILLLVLGCFLPPVSIIVMVTPVLFPLIVGLGFDPIWFGVIMTINMEAGLITPPVGLNLYVIKGIAPDARLQDILVGAIPYVGILCVAIVLFSFFPELVTWLPQLLY
jgi:TRAP-type C4-dicarboxylate transport system permease large subunit